ncbi:hypothetical protein [Devosia sp.]|uniref:hypothetical protein n=1 Tax=Devosia sp. TaxID=1871048 RepID=UPI00273734E7|nr:hypothetical protein [Devosia sp.]MDP2782655.1 hypothetical protein [Devosia sp.]
MTDDDQIGQWVRASEIGALGRQPVSEKIIDGIISEEDMTAMEKILRSVTSGLEMNEIRHAMIEGERDFSDLGQRTRFRVFLAQNP